MKKIILIAVVILAAHTAQAAEEAAWRAHCKRVSEMSTMIMEKRQKNVPMQMMMDNAPNKTTKNFIVAAYKKPIYSNEKQKQDAIDKFTTQSYQICAKPFLAKESQAKK